jgi:hypothetical protein
MGCLGRRVSLLLHTTSARWQAFSTEEDCSYDYELLGWLSLLTAYNIESTERCCSIWLHRSGKAVIGKAKKSTKTFPSIPKQ